MYAWLTYEQIRRGIEHSALAPSAKGKEQILTALGELEAKGCVHSKGKLWGFTAEYNSRAA